MNLVRQRETVRKQQEYLKAEGKSADSKRARIKMGSNKKKATDRSKRDLNDEKCKRCLGQMHPVKGTPGKELNCRKCMS